MNKNTSRETIRASMGKLINQPVEKLIDSRKLSDIIHDSMVLAEMIMELEAEYDAKFSQETLTNSMTVGSLIDVILGRTLSPASAATH